MTKGKIADILQMRGDLDGALRIRREEELPVYERLGDARAAAVTKGKIADILEMRGDLDGALRIRREEAIAGLRAARRRALAAVSGRANLGDYAAAARAAMPIAPRRATCCVWRWREARRLQLPEAGQIEAIIAQAGLGEG